MHETAFNHAFMKMVKYEKEYDQDKKEAGLILVSSEIIRLIRYVHLFFFFPDKYPQMDSDNIPAFAHDTNSGQKRSCDDAH